MKKIGFIDYYLSEWHADNYPNWIKEANAALGTDYQVAYGWAELDVSPRDGVTTAQWCEKFGVTPCATLEEICEKSDVLLILAPSDPEKHLPYAKVALTYGKPTYIDKTFAPDLAEAKEMFAIAAAHSTPLFSSSALRYATELDSVEGCYRIMTTGSGKTADEYIVHQAEMVVKKLGLGAKTAMAEPWGEDEVIFRVGYDDSRSAVMCYTQKASPFTLYMVGKEKTSWKKADSAFFPALLTDILRFYEEKTVSFDVAETLEVMKIREGVLKARETPNTWIEL